MMTRAGVRMHGPLSRPAIEHSCHAEADARMVRAGAWDTRLERMPRSQPEQRDSRTLGTINRRGPPRMGVHMGVQYRDGRDERMI